IGNPARRTPRSKARATSRWLAKRIFPRLAYRTTRCCTGGAAGGVLGVGFATLLSPLSRANRARHRQHRQHRLLFWWHNPPERPGGVHPLSRWPRLDLCTHRGAHSTLVARGPSAVLDLGRP